MVGGTKMSWTTPALRKESFCVLFLNSHREDYELAMPLEEARIPLLLRHWIPI